MIGVPTLVGAAIVIGRKFQILDSLSVSITSEIRPDLKEIRERFFIWEGKMAEMYKNGSPVQLQEKGNAFLVETGLKKYLDAHIKSVLDAYSAKFKMGTAYDVQESVFTYMSEYSFEPEFEKRLKEAAYREGISMDVVRRIGAIYLRDRCLESLGMDGKDIDAS